jgi:hypothetical protein
VWYRDVVDDDLDNDGQGLGKAGVGVGLLAALGLGGLKVADNCAGAARGLRAADEVALAGGGVRVADDALHGAKIERVGGRVGASAADDALHHGAAVERVAIDEGARGRGFVAHPVAIGEESEFTKLAEVASDVGFEFVGYGLDVEAPPPEKVATAAHKPSFTNLSTDADAWRRLVDGDDTTISAPRVFVGKPMGDALHVGKELVPIAELGSACARIGASCVFVACDKKDCTDETSSVLGEATKIENRKLELYIADFASARLSREPLPKFIAIVDVASLELKLLRPRS